MSSISVIYSSALSLRVSNNAFCSSVTLSSFNNASNFSIKASISSLSLKASLSLSYPLILSIRS